MKLQLDNCPILAVWLRPTTNNNQHTNQIHAACYKVVGSSPSCSQIFFHSMFNPGIANGAKAGLKLRLKTPYILCLLNTWGSPLFDHMDWFEFFWITFLFRFWIVFPYFERGQLPVPTTWSNHVRPFMEQSLFSKTQHYFVMIWRRWTRLIAKIECDYSIFRRSTLVVWTPILTSADKSLLVVLSRLVRLTILCLCISLSFSLSLSRLAIVSLCSLTPSETPQQTSWNIVKVHRNQILQWDNCQLWGQW